MVVLEQLPGHGLDLGGQGAGGICKPGVRDLFPACIRSFMVPDQLPVPPWRIGSES